MKRRPPTGNEIRQLALLRSDPRLLTLVENSLVLRLPMSSIYEKLHREYQIDPEMAHRFVRIVLQRWEKEQKRGSKHRKAHMRATLDAFYTQALKDKKYSSALNALRELIRLDGLAAPDRLQLDVRTMTAEQAVKEIQECNEILELSKRRGIIDIDAVTVEETPDTGSESGGGETH